MNVVFADTFYFPALLNKHDEAHHKAVELSSQVRGLLTTEWILTELADGLASSRHRNMFVQRARNYLKSRTYTWRLSICNSTKKQFASMRIVQTRNGHSPIALRSL